MLLIDLMHVLQRPVETTNRRPPPKRYQKLINKSILKALKINRLMTASGTFVQSTVD